MNEYDYSPSTEMGGAESSVGSSGGFFTGFLDAIPGLANSAASIMGALGKPAPAGMVQPASVARPAGGVPVWAWVAGGVAAVIALVLLLRK